MQFSTGLLDYLFGEKVTVEVPGDDGKTIRRQVTRKWLNKMQQERQMRKVEGEVIRVHHLALHGYQVDRWIVGQDVSLDDVKRFRNPVTQEMYAVSMLEDGTLKRYLLTKDQWESTRSQLQQQGLL